MDKDRTNECEQMHIQNETSGSISANIFEHLVERKHTKQKKLNMHCQRFYILLAISIAHVSQLFCEMTKLGHVLWLEYWFASFIYTNHWDYLEQKKNKKKIGSAEENK